MSINPTRVNDEFSSSPQIAVEDITEIAQQGYKTLLNCRPDGEGGAEQPVSAQIQHAAEQQGLVYIYLPVVMGTDPALQQEAARKALAAAPKPIYGFCKSGMRATKVYLAATNAGNA